jgi:DNA ligase (NAD+)
MNTEQQELTERLIAASRSYYVNAEPVMTDAEFDAGLRRLAELEAKTGTVIPGSPTRVVGSDLGSELPKVRRAKPMLSLGNIFTVDEALKFFKDGDELTVEPKVDGMSLELYYEDGQLVRALTRGDGLIGEDVTHNARTVAGIPLVVETVGAFQVRGEVVMTGTQLARINAIREAEGDPPFANCRNAAAGSMKIRSPQECARRGLSFVGYWTNLEFVGNGDDSQVNRVSTLRALGFSTVHDLIPSRVIAARAEGHHAVYKAALAEAIEDVRIRRETLDVDLDGAVLKANLMARQDELGAGNKAPHWGAAFKFPPEEVQTVLEDIVIQIGRTGQVTPVAKLRPVHVGGVTVTSASLMNRDEWERVGSPSPGDTVTVLRSAEVIPRICGTTTYAAPVHDRWVWPSCCPHCHTELVRDGVHYFDPNPDCPARVTAYLKHATSKAVLDWDGLGDAAVQRLYEGGVRNLADLFTVDLTTVFTGAELTKLTAERERVKGAPLWRKLAALGAEDVGTTYGKLLANKYGSLVALLNANFQGARLAEGDCWFLDRPPGAELVGLIGEVAAQHLTDRLRELREVLGALESAGFHFADAASDAPRPLAGKTFCLTGTLLTSGRDAMVQRLESLGAVVKSSVSKNTDYVIVGEQPGSTKMQAAARHGTAQLTEAQLYELLGEPVPAPADLEEREV